MLALETREEGMADRDFDVIVAGGGGGGMAAAITAADAGARVLLVEAARKLGGSTALSGGVFFAAGTSVQREAGHADDSAEDLFDYYLTLNQYRVEPAVVRRLCAGAAEGLEWLRDLGVEFRPGDLYRSGLERVPRGHAARGQGQAIADALEAAVQGREIEVALANRLESLLLDDAGVAGIRAGGAEVRAPAVVLATGGFGHDPDLVARHYPEAAAAGDWTWCISAPTCVGDGFRIASAAGASIGGHDRGLLLTTPGFAKQLEVYAPGWLVYVNREGRRFVNETAPYAVMSGVIREQGGVCWAIFDEAARAAAAPEPEFAEAFAADALPLNWVAEVLEKQANAGRIARVATLEGLAGAIGLPAEALATTVARYNACCAERRDVWFEKDASVLRPIATPPFYAAEIRPAIICLTACGPRIDPEARVLDRADRPIPGLFAAGEVTGNVLGERYVGGGNSIANCIVFGRIAGAAAARVAAG